MTNKQALEQSKKYSELFVYQIDNLSTNQLLKNGYWSFKIESIDSTNTYYEAMSDLLVKSSVDQNTTYQWIAQILGDIEERIDSENEIDELFTAESWQDHIVEYADSEVPTYNTDLTMWMSQGNNWIAVDEATDEFGQSESVLDSIRRGYAMAIESLYQEILTTIEGGENE